MATRCPACDATRSHRAWRVDGYDLHRCRECRTLFVLNPPAANEVAAIYDDPGYRRPDPVRQARHEADARRRAAVVASLGARRVLEIGCAEGRFLCALTDHGIDAEGLEPGPSGTIAEAAGHTVHRATIESFNPTSAGYDAIAMWDVLEHLQDPAAALLRLRPWLVAGGRLLLSTPSISGIPARLMGRRFPMICPPEHLSVFSETGLRRLLQRCGLAPCTRTSSSALDQPTLARVLARRLPVSPPWVTRKAAKLLVHPAAWMDRLGLGTTFEVVAELEATVSRPAIAAAG